MVFKDRLNKGKCAGCYENEKATWCEVRKCCRENGYSTCADCTIMTIKECKLYYNIFAKIIGFVTHTDRSRCITRIKEIGVESFTKEMSKLKIMSLKK